VLKSSIQVESFYNGERMREIKHPKNKENFEYYIQGLISKKYKLRQIAQITGYTIQQLSRIKIAYQEQGAAIFINGHKGKTSKRKISDEKRNEIIRIYNTDFDGFNFSFFRDALEEFYNINFSYRTIYKILTAAGIKSPEKHNVKRDKHHRTRLRREHEGELVQIDATPFQWFAWCGDKKYYALHGAIDDATGKITALSMAENECVYGYYDILEQTIERYGVMFDIYSDRAPIFCATPKSKNNLTIQEQLSGLHEKRTQWQKILDFFHINQVLAWSPQAKGRVERMWGTIQGRLPWYFKKYKIKTIEDANEFLKHQFINVFNDEFSISRDTENIWRKPPQNYKDNICSRYERTANSAGEISFQGYKFRVNAPKCEKKKIELCIYKNAVRAKFNGNYYGVELLDELTGGIGETMSESLKNIISRYMLSDAKRVEQY